MYISNSDLDFLVGLEKTLGLYEYTQHEAKKLKKLTDKLIANRDKRRESIRNTVAKKRKADKTYGRSKKEIETIERRAKKNGKICKS